jgi:hypothetical protein
LGRAPSGWTDAKIKLIQEQFIAAAVPTELCRLKCPEGEFLRGAGIHKHWVTSSGYFSCLSAGGKWLGHAPSEKVLETFRSLPEAERKPAAIDVRDLDSGETAIPAPPPDGLVLRVHCRFLARDERGGLRHVTQADFPRSSGDLGFLLEPNTDYLWLTAQEWRALIPAGPAKGQEARRFVGTQRADHALPPVAVASADQRERHRAEKRDQESGIDGHRR